MTQTSPADDLDRLLSDFFKAQLKKPWPNAPLPTAASAEPSALAAVRSADAPRNESPRPRDATARARFTLAASVALALGAGLYLTDGFAPDVRQPNAPVPARGFTPGDQANVKDDPRMKAIEEGKAKDPPPADEKVKLDELGDERPSR